MFRVALLGAWHVHFDQYATEISSREDCTLAALWDDDESRGRAAAARYGVDFVPDLDSLLGRGDVDGVAVCSATNLHPLLLQKAAAAGKHIFTEKVLAFTLADALAIADAVRQSGVAFCISFPWLCRDFIQGALQAVREGVLGDITYARVRNCHNGATADWLPSDFYDPVPCGGGAMMDLGAHSMYLLDAFLGLPETISSAFTHVTGRAVEDNAVSLLTYAGGAIGSSETGFVCENDPFSLEICGTKGTWLTGGPDCRSVLSTDGGFREALLPAPLKKPVDQWVDGVLNGAPIPFSVDKAIRLSQLMETAYLSARTGRAVPLVK